MGLTHPGTDVHRHSHILVAQVLLDALRGSPRHDEVAGGRPLQIVKAEVLQLSPQRRKEIARKAALARWERRVES